MSDVLASWNDGVARETIVGFVERAVSDAWLGTVLAEHYAGDDTNVRTLLHLSVDARDCREDVGFVEDLVARLVHAHARPERRGRRWQPV